MKTPETPNVETLLYNERNWLEIMHGYGCVRLHVRNDDGLLDPEVIEALVKAHAEGKFPHQKLK